ncbi:phosphoenolpyruvate carboxykinase (ATP), partial [Patescibacteria group bacterium]|nr:phosphoenolpyruvate carboxykinase (ATP) [Patescibacteria group bacterium]
MEIFKKVAKDLVDHKHSYWTPGSFDLALWSKKNSIPNRDNIPVFHSKIKSRNKDGTVDNVNKLPAVEQKKIEAVIKKAYKNMWDRDIIAVERIIGAHSEGSMKFRVFVPKEYPQLAYMVYNNFFKAPEDRPIDVTTIMIPDFDEQMTLVDPISKVTFILGSDYYGELKMSLLRMTMHVSREKKKSLGLHAGSKVYWLRDKKKQLKKKGVLIFGLSGTGKTTITTMGHGLKYPERVRIRQDDINIINEEGYCIGTERN